MGVHQAWREVNAGQGVMFQRVAAAAARVDAGNHIANDTNISFANFAGRHINNSGIGEQKIKRGLASCGLNGAAAVFSIAGHNNSGAGIMRATLGAEQTVAQMIKFITR